jgi:hypothetical protein
MSRAASKHRGLDRQYLEALARDGDGDGDGDGGGDGDGDAGAAGLVASRNRGKDLCSMNARPPRVLFATLTEATSAAGRPYLRGWAGASNLVAFRGEPDEQGRPTWDLFLAERPPRQAPARGGEASAAHARSYRREGAKARQERMADEVLQRHGEPALDDELPF